MRKASSIIAIGSDHAGWALKNTLLRFLSRRGFRVLNFGCDNDQTRVDYPDYAKSVALAVHRKKADMGVLCCGTGIGMSIAANKIPGIRAAVVWNQRSATLAKEHNAANILCLSGRLLSIPQAKRSLLAFLSAEVSTEPRHKKRIKKIAALERNHQ